MPSYVLKKRKNYYKRVWEDWTQPALTANGTMGGESFAVSTKDVNSSYPAYKAFDGIKSDFGAIFTKTSGYLELYNPRLLKISSLSVLNFAGDAYGIRSIKAGYIQASNDGSEYETIKEFTNDAIGGGQSWNISLSDNDTGYKYYRIVATDTSYVNSAASSQVAITELSIIAQEAVLVPATKDDYDFMGDNQSYILKRKINKYYKDTVTTKYWKEVTTTVNGVAYACYYGMPSQGIMSPYIYYVKTPLGSDTTLYYYSEWDAGDAFPSYATDVSQLSPSDFGFTLSSVTETTMTFSNVTLTRQSEHDLYADVPATTVVEGTPDDYTYTTTETETVEVGANDDWDRVVVDSEPAYFLTQRGNWQPIYEDYTLPKMTSRTAPEGAVSTNIGNGEYTIDAYNFFFNRSWYFEAEGREGSRYNRYTFARPLKPDTYTISFGGNLQQQDSNSGTLSVWYDDGTIETLITYTLSTAGQTFSKTFTATKPIRTISIDMTVSRRDNKNDVTTFYGLNIVSETGQLQVFTGYKQDKE